MDGFRSMHEGCREALEGKSLPAGPSEMPKRPMHREQQGIRTFARPAMKRMLHSPPLHLNRNPWLRGSCTWCRRKGHLGNGYGCEVPNHPRGGRSTWTTFLPRLSAT